MHYFFRPTHMVNVLCNRAFFFSFLFNFYFLFFIEDHIFNLYLKQVCTLNVKFQIVCNVINETRFISIKLSLFGNHFLPNV